MAPRTSDQRGPASSAIAPTIGAPMGVSPTNAVDHSAVTRPRNAGAAASCAVLLPLVKKVHAGGADQREQHDFDPEGRDERRRQGRETKACGGSHQGGDAGGGAFRRL